MASRNISDIHTFIEFLIRKERGQFISPAQKDMILAAGQLDAVQEWFEPYGRTQSLHDALRVIRVYQPFTSDSGGFVSYNSNYLHLIGCPFTVYGSAVTKPTMINEDEFADAMRSQIRAVSNAYPIIIDTTNGFSIYPQSVQTGAYWYLRLPATPVYGYTQSGRTITYNSATSTQIEFSDIYINHIIALGLKHIGIDMDDDKVIQYAELFKQETTVT